MSRHHLAAAAFLIFLGCFGLGIGLGALMHPEMEVRQLLPPPITTEQLNKYCAEHR